MARRLARLLANRGDRVRGLIRNPEHADDLRADGAEPVVCDLESASTAALAEAIGGADAVVFAAGAGPGSGAERKLTVDRDGAIKLLDAAVSAGVTRYVIVSSVGAESPPDDDDVFSVYLRAKAEADAAVVQSDRDWTVVRPGILTDDSGDRQGAHPGRADPRGGHAPRRGGGAGGGAARAALGAPDDLRGRRRRPDRGGAGGACSREGRADDRGPGGRDLGGLAGARARLRGERDRDAVPLRPLPVRVRPQRARVARRLGDHQRARRDHVQGAPRDARLAGHVPPPGRAGQGGRHGGPRLGRPRRAGPRHGLERGRARGLRLPVPAARASGCARWSASCR